MTAKCIPVCCAGALLVGGMFLFGLGGHPAWAAQTPETTGQLQPVPADGQLESSVAVEESSIIEDDEYEDFYGMLVCSPPGRFWLRADYLMWWTSGTRLPPMVTTSPQGTARAQAGVLGYPNTSILYGDRTIGTDGRSGYRTTLGMWLGACHVWSVEFDYFSLGARTNGFSQTSYGNPILARPFFDVQANQQASQLVAYPDVVEGTIAVSTMDYFQSAGALLSYNLCSSNLCEPCYDPCDDPEVMGCGPPLLYCCRTDLLIGLRYYNLSDRVGVHEDLRMIEEGPTQNATFNIQDNFHTRNDFYGSEIALRTQIYRGRWSLEILTKLAMGNTHQTVTIDGQTIVAMPDQPTQTYDAGLFALASPPANIGTYDRDLFTVIPQLGIELGYQVNCHWRMYAGYSVFYWGSVVRAARQIDLNLDPRNFPTADQPGSGLPFPAFDGRTDSFWAHGVNVGTEFRF